MKTRLLIALSTLCLFCSSIVAYAVRFEEGMCEEVEEEPIGE